MIDVSKSLRDRNALALTNPITSLEPAKLAGVPGVGILQVIRTLDGEILEIIGTWRLVEDGDNNTERLKRAHQDQESVSYQGHFSDPLHLDVGTVTVDVRILAVRAYQYDAQEEMEGKETTKTLYRLEPVGSLPHLNQKIVGAVE
jgi:hypothetical protein